MTKTLVIYKDVMKVSESKKFEYKLPLLLKTDDHDEPEFIWIKEDMSAVYIKKSPYNKSRTVMKISNFELELEDHNIDLRVYHKTTKIEEFKYYLSEALACISEELS
jgi:hypothetical protein